MAPLAFSGEVIFVFHHMSSENSGIHTHDCLLINEWIKISSYLISFIKFFNKIITTQNNFRQIIIKISNNKITQCEGYNGSLAPHAKSKNMEGNSMGYLMPREVFMFAVICKHN